jgi:hypothetical protein
MGFNRNIIIAEDINKWMDPGSPNPKSMGANPPAFVPATLAPAVAPAVAVPAEAVPVGKAALPAQAFAETAPEGGAAPAAPTVMTIPNEDDYLTKLLKYVPIEVLGAYLFMAGVIDSNVTNRHDRAIWLGTLLIGILVLTIPYDRVVLKVIRSTQIAMSVVGLAVYVFALGGWFSTTTWYHQWYASIVVPAFGFVIAVLKLPPLPEEKAPAAS